MKINSDLKIENTNYTVKNLVDTLDKTKNNLSSLTTYSSTEQKTEKTWIDGRPIYRRSFTGITTSTVGTATNLAVTTVGRLDGNYTQWNVISVYGSVQSNSYNTFPLSVPSYGGAGGFWAVTNDGKIEIYIASGNFSNRPYFLTIEYIKTADKEEVA